MTMRLFALGAALPLSGCLALPLPEHGDGRTPWISGRAVEQLVAGTTSRTDVVMKLGEPTWRAPDDGVFEYGWQSVVGVIGIGGVGAPAAVGDITRRRRLCLQFDGNGVLISRHLAESGVFGTKEPSCTAKADESAAEAR